MYEIDGTATAVRMGEVLKRFFENNGVGSRVVIKDIRSKEILT